MVYLTTVYDLDSINMYEKGVQRTFYFCFLICVNPQATGMIGLRGFPLHNSYARGCVSKCHKIGYLDLEDRTKVSRDSLK